MSLELNAFNQYDHAENRLTHALGVTLERSRSFQAIFLKELAGGIRLRRKTEVTLQMAGGGWEEHNGEKCGIPDLAIIDDNNHAVIVEAKLGAGLSCLQLASHENRADKNDLKVVAALAITGRDKDQETLAGWLYDKRLAHPWLHVSWQEVYGLVCRLADKYGSVDHWLRELRDYMQIMAASLNENEMGADVKIISFTGIPEELIDDYSTKYAKRVLRSLMDELRGDRKFLKEMRLPQTPGKRKAIKNSPRLWDVLAPDGKAFNDSHHFTIGLNPDGVQAYLTIPNTSFRKFGKYVESVSVDEFAVLIRAFVDGLEKKGIIKAGGRPFINMSQNRFDIWRHYAGDGRAEFDVRTFTGLPGRKREPAIKRQPEWLHFCRELIVNKRANIQFQLGVRFYFSNCRHALSGAKATNLFKDTFRATMPVVRKTGYA